MSQVTVTNHGAACCVIECNGIRILCDPWLFGRIYLGAWEREHPLLDPVGVVGRVDYIWVSHCHDDHFHPPSIQAVLAVNPQAKLWIGDAPHLRSIMQRHGFEPLVQSYIQGPGFTATAVPNRCYGQGDGYENVDTALIVASDTHAVVNMNDNPYDQAQVDVINALTAGLHVTALLPYAGAGPWPQCFEMSRSDLERYAQEKEERFLTLFKKYRFALRADIAHPFSAGYRLTGRLQHLNQFRGVCPQERVPLAVVLPVVGAAPREDDALAWESDPVPDDVTLHRLIATASMRAPKVDGEPLTIDLDWGRSAAYVDATWSPAPKAHETIHLDPCLLHGLLTRKWHWNAAEIGSCLRITRHGAAFDPRVFTYLYRLHV